MTGEINQSNGQTKNPEPNRAFSRWDRVYIWLDSCRKFLTEVADDVLTYFVLIFGTIGAFFARLTSAVLAWSGNRSKQKAQIPLNIIKIFIGAILVSLVSLLALAVALLAGTIGALLGFRNIAEYSRREQFAVWIAFITFVVTIPFFVSSYTLFKISLVFAYALGVLGLDFLYGQCGILSLGQSGFLLLGGYVTTWMANGFFGVEFPILFSVVVAALAMGAIGVLLGTPSLRIKDYYLVIMSMTFSLAIPKILKSPHFKSFSGLREGGIPLRTLEPLPGLSGFGSPINNYYLVAVSALLLFYIAYYIIHHSQIGRAFKTIKCDNEVSMILGIPVMRYKLLAFTLSAIYGGFCGAFLNILTKFIHPDVYSIHNSVNFLVANVVGGPGTLLGSLLGGIFLAFEPDFTLKMSELIPRGKDLASAFYGVILISAVLFVPRGIAGQLSSWLKSRLQSGGRRGVYSFNPPPDYDLLPEDKKMTPMSWTNGGS